VFSCKQKVLLFSWSWFDNLEKIWCSFWFDAENSCHFMVLCVWEIWKTGFLEQEFDWNYIGTLSKKSSQCVSILSICEEEMKILAIFLRHANLKRKKIKRKQDFSESPEYFKMRKLVSLTFWFLRERNCNTCLFHQKRNFIQIFYQGHFNLIF
jgi:hypothetical protein